MQAQPQGVSFAQVLLESPTNMQDKWQKKGNAFSSFIALPCPLFRSSGGDVTFL